MRTSHILRQGCDILGAHTEQITSYCETELGRVDDTLRRLLLLSM